MSRRAGRSLWRTALMAVAGAGTMLAFSWVLLAGGASADAHRRSQAEQRRAEAAAARELARQAGMAVSAESRTNIDDAAFDDDADSTDVDLDTAELTVDGGDLPEALAAAPGTGAAPKAGSGQGVARSHSGKGTIIATTSPKSKRSTTRVVSQGSALGATALVLLALLGAGLAMGLFHSDATTRNWIGAITLTSFVGLLLAWRGVVAPQYVGRGAVVALFVLMAYGFVDAAGRGRYTWPIRIGVVAAFVAVCCVLSMYGRAV